MNDVRRPRNMKHVSGIGSGRTLHGCSRYHLSCGALFHANEEDVNLLVGFLFSCLFTVCSCLWRRVLQIFGWSKLDCVTLNIPSFDLKNYTLTDVEVKSPI